MTPHPTDAGPKLAPQILRPVTLVAMAGLLLVASAAQLPWPPDVRGFVLPVAAVLAMLLPLWTLRRCIRRTLTTPLQQFVATIDACAVNPRSQRVPAQPAAELQRVANAINRSLDRTVRNEGRHRAILDAAADGIVTINHRGIIQSFNAAAEVLFGYRATAVLGRNVSLLVPEPHRRNHDGYLQRYLETGIARMLDMPREVTAVRADGSQFPISLTISRVDMGDEPPMFTGIVRDVTEERQAQRNLIEHATRIEQINAELAEAKHAAEVATQQAEAANRSKSDFLANMSHEIRTPMTAILGYAENLLEDELGASERRMAVETILRNGDHLMTLINDILDLSRIEAGKLAVEQVAIEPFQLLQDVAALMRVRAEQKKLQLVVHGDGPLPVQVVSDPTRVRQVLINLCGNAIKFTSTGQITMRMKLLRATGNEPQLQIEVRDTGIGMTQEQIRRLFQPFEQADSSTTRRFGGSGLGLSISKRLVQMLGGRIAVASEPGKGTVFRVTLPTGPLQGVELREYTGAVPSSPPASGHAPSASAGFRLNGHVLLADDGADNQRLVTYILQKAGARVTVACDGQSALDQALAAEAGQQAFDLVLMDMQMPVMDGYEAAKALRAQGYQKPIVALTANAMAGDREKCLQAGCTEFAAKPIDRRQLLTTLASLLPGSTTPPGVTAVDGTATAGSTART